jgi:4-carboxymuconolactone decarboxylase
MRSPRLLAPLQKAGEYLRFDSALPRRVCEFATLVVSRQWTQQFEWAVHVPLARQEGTTAETIEAVRVGRRPCAMSAEETCAYDFIIELAAFRGVSDATYAKCVQRFGECGVIDLVGVIGYFGLMSMVLNVARTPADAAPDVAALPPLPL